jgi:hypothetical protein
MRFTVAVAVVSALALSGCTKTNPLTGATEPP